jgi:hypothetical protein
MAYSPEPAPDANDFGAVVEWITRELRRVGEFSTLVESGQWLEIRAVAPTKPREGMLAIADGTNWNPGSGKGLYEYRSGAWVKL